MNFNKKGRVVFVYVTTIAITTFIAVVLTGLLLGGENYIIGILGGIGAGYLSATYSLRKKR
jgi:hypothetical protein